MTTKTFVDFKFPVDWLQGCYDQSYIDIFTNSVKTKYLNLGNQNVYGEELNTIEYLLDRVRDFTECCIPGTRNSCSSCISGDDVFFDLATIDLLPSYLGEIVNPDTSVDQSCLCLNYTTANAENNSRSFRGLVTDMANLIVAIDGESVDFGVKIDELLNYTGSTDFTGIITKNENFCNAELINNLKVDYEDSEKAIWLHIWENYDSDAPDVIFLKMKTGEELAIVDTDFNLNGPENMQTPPPFEYRIEQRCFALWDRFGDLPISKATRNSFHGDNRTFSLEEFAINPTAHGATARTFQETKIKLGVGIVPGSSRGLCSTTYGFRNFLRALPIFYPGSSVLKEYQPVDEQSETGIIIGEPRSLIHENVTYTTMHLISGNPLVDLAWFFAPIEWMVKLNFSYLENDSLLLITGDISGREFPAHETIIRDDCGNSTFINTMPSPSEADLAAELLNPIHDYLKGINISIKVDEAGCFDSEINVDGQIFDISAWNTENLLKEPAVDCSGIPCEGTYKN